MTTRLRRGQQVAFYRSPVTRWAMIGSGALAAYGLSPLGPRAWRLAPALQWLQRAVPFPFMVAGFAVYVALALTQRGFLAACLLGMGIYAGYTIALIVVTAEGQPGSAIGIAAFILATAEHYGAARRAEFDRDRP